MGRKQTMHGTPVPRRDVEILSAGGNRLADNLARIWRRNSFSVASGVRDARPSLVGSSSILTRSLLGNSVLSLLVKMGSILRASFGNGCDYMNLSAAECPGVGMARAVSTRYGVPVSRSFRA